MKLLSLNCKGLASTRKKLALKRMMEVLSPEVILLQETMGPEMEVEILLSSLLPLYSFTTQSAIGHSRGLSIGWKKSSIQCTNSWGSSFGIGAQLCWEDTNATLTIVNIYGPYSNRSKLWDSFRKSGFVKEIILIIVGDLNFNLGAHEIWGPKARIDPLASYFSNLMMESKLVDVDPQILKPTWSNKWVGEERIVKILDISMLSEYLL